MDDVAFKTKVSSAPPQEQGRLRQDIAHYNNDKLGDAKCEFLWIGIPGVAELTGQFLWKDLNLNYFFVDERFRRRGLGTKLLNLAEEAARKRGAISIWFDSYNTDMVTLAKRLNYETVCELGSPKRYLIVKHLQE